MQYLVYSILCSVSVSVLLKLVPRYDLDIRQAIFVNYVVAGCATWALLRPELSSLRTATSQAWVVLFLLGVGLPLMFWVLAAAVRYAGVVRTDAAMRLSLLLPLTASFTLMGEAFSLRKGAGMVLGFAAIGLLITRDTKDVAQRSFATLALLMTTFIGMGCIDILFKLLAAMHKTSSSAVLFTAFALSAGVALLALVWLYLCAHVQFRFRHIAAGLALGVLNFGNIYTYIQAHRAMAQSPSLVFAAMNIGVIGVATLVGVLAFNESLGRLHALGLAVAVTAVIVLASAV